MLALPILQFTQQMTTKSTITDNMRVPEAATSAVCSNVTVIAARSFVAKQSLPPAPALPRTPPPWNLSSATDDNGGSDDGGHDDGGSGGGSGDDTS